MGGEDGRIFRNVPPAAIPARSTTNPYRSQTFDQPPYCSGYKPRRICSACGSVIQAIRGLRTERRPGSQSQESAGIGGNHARPDRSAKHRVWVSARASPRTALLTRVRAQSRRCWFHLLTIARPPPKITAHSRFRPRFACSHVPLEFRSLQLDHIKRPNRNPHAFVQPAAQGRPSRRMVLTPLWRKADSNLYGAFPVKWWFLV